MGSGREGGNGRERGAREGGGIPISLLPSFDTVANEHAALVVSTELGHQIGLSMQARLQLVETAFAGAGSVVVASFGGNSTTNEVVDALAFGQTVYGLCGAP